MKNLVLLTTVVAIVAVGIWAAVVSTAYADEPKYKIKQVMQQAQKGPLLKKVLSGNASDDEKAKLVELYTALNQNSPPKGDVEAWKTRTQAMVDAANSGDTAALKKIAADCMGCHSNHKGK